MPNSNSNSAIHVAHLSKTYQVPEREAGLAASLKSLVKRKTRDIKAVDAISFDIAPGEVVGFLGPNGAGKTTTLKMLSGLLYPSSGEGQVLGYLPSKRQKDFLRQITLVMGNRNQLQWDIPALDSFELNRAIYGLPEAQYKQTRDQFIELLELGDLVKKPVRNLSLGERMKMEIVGALLHRLPEHRRLMQETVEIRSLRFGNNLRQVFADEFLGFASQGGFQGVQVVFLLFRRNFFQPLQQPGVATAISGLSFELSVKTRNRGHGW